MRSNKIIHIVALLTCIIAFYACTNKTQTILGEYHYQTSGQVTIDGAQVLPLTPEKGDMDIIQKDASTLMLIFYAEDGTTYTADAIIEDKNISVNPYTKLLPISYYIKESSLLGGTTNRLIQEHYNTGVYSIGTLYENAIIFTMQYSGNELSTGKKLVGKDIQLIAKKK